MNTKTHPITLTMLVLAAFAAAGAAGADTSSNSSATPAAKSEDVNTGSVDAATKEDRQRRFDDCMATWDKDTHMTKQQWRRTCKNAFEELPRL